MESSTLQARSVAAKVSTGACQPVVTRVRVIDYNATGSKIARFVGTFVGVVAGEIGTDVVASIADRVTAVAGAGDAVITDFGRSS